MLLKQNHHCRYAFIHVLYGIFGLPSTIFIFLSSFLLLYPILSFSILLYKVHIFMRSIYENTEIFQQKKEKKNKNISSELNQTPPEADHIYIKLN